MLEQIIGSVKYLFSPGHLVPMWSAVLLGGLVFTAVERLYPATLPDFKGLRSTSLAAVIYLVFSPLAGVIPAVAVNELLAPLRQNLWWPVPLNLNVFAFLWDSPPSATGYVPSTIAVMLFSVIGLLVSDFFYYWFHRLQHTTFLWEQHKLHHSEAHLCVVTSYRVHWLEDALRAILLTLPMGLVFNFTPLQVAWLAYVMPQWGHFIHANLRINFGPLTPIISGPQYHRIHHSLDPNHRDKNFAAFFPIWDILFGTYYRPRRNEFPATGIEGVNSHVRLRDMLLEPFTAWARALSRAQSHRRLTLEGLCLVVCAILLAALVMALVFARPDIAYLRATFTPEHVDLLQMHDSRGQQWAHRVFAGGLALYALTLWYARPVRISLFAPALLISLTRWARSHAGMLVTTLLTASVLLNFRGLPGSNLYIVQGPFYALTLLPSVQTVLLFMVLGTGVMFMVTHASRTRPGRDALCGAAKVGLAATFLYGGCLYVLGLATVPDFHGFTPEGVAAIEWHYSGSVGSADRLGTGAHLKDVPIHSGVLPSVLLGAWQQANGMLDFGAHIRLTQFLQLAFGLTAAVAYCAWYRHRVGATALALLLTLPWVLPLHAAVLYPNQSALRFLGLALGLLALISLRNGRPLAIAAPLGLIGGAALLWNAETGVCISAGYLVFLLARSSAILGRFYWIPSFVSFLCGMVAALAAFAVTLRLSFGYWIDVASFIKSVPLVGAFAQGYAGLELKNIEPLAVLIFTHSAYIAVRHLLRWGAGRELNSRNGAELAIATVLLMWAAYYFKGPHFWNLWSFIFLYGFLLGRLVSADHLPRAIRSSAARFLASAKAITVALIVIPSVLATNMASARSALTATYALFHRTQCSNEELLSGVCLPSDMALALREKATLLREENARQPVLFFSANSYFMPLLSGITPPLRERDAFMDSLYRSDLGRIAENIIAIKPSCVLFDAPGTPFEGSLFHRSFYRKLRQAISTSYGFSGSSRGWEVWCQSAKT